MRVIIERSKNSSVIIKNNVYNEIKFGLVILVCFANGDTIDDINYIVKKVINLRIFKDEFGKMNKNIKDVGGSILSISQFTLYALTSSGNRPNYMKALNSSEASLLYDKFNELLGNEVEVKTGIFGENMELRVTNDGPITIIIDSKDK